MTLKETALILNQGLTISGKPLREHLEAVNHKQAIEELEKIVAEKSPLNEKTLFSLHGLILKGISDEDAGIYRRYSVHILGAIHIPPNPIQVPQLMTDLFNWFTTQKKNYTQLNWLPFFITSLPTFTLSSMETDDVPAWP